MQGQLRSSFWPLFWLVFFLAFSYPGCPSVAQPQTAPEPETWPPSTLPLQPTVIGTSSRAMTLLERLEQRRIQIESLESTLKRLEQQGRESSAAYARLWEELQKALESQARLQKELTATSASREKLQQDYDTQQSSSKAYQAEAELQIGEFKRERNGWRLAGIGGILAAIAAVVYAAVK